MVLAAWNAGNAYLENKLNEIEAVVEAVKPGLLVVSEGNFRKSVDQSTVQIPVTNCSLPIRSKILMSRISAES